jgi:hypothetical protein
MSAAASSRTTTVIIPNLANGSGVEPASETSPPRAPPVPSGPPERRRATLGKACLRPSGRSPPRAALPLGAAPPTTFCESRMPQACGRITPLRWLEQTSTRTRTARAHDPMFVTRPSTRPTCRTARFPSFVLAGQLHPHRRVDEIKGGLCVFLVFWPDNCSIDTTI